MKLPKNFLNTTSVAKYREYLKLLPNLQHENTRIITTLILTFLAMSFFGIFAINPTITTIVQLRRQLADSKLVYEKLHTKIQNLGLLTDQYRMLEPDLHLVQEAIPENSNSPMMMAQVLGLAKERRVKVNSFEVKGTPLATSVTMTDPDSSTFFIQANGTYEDLISFIKDLTRLNRIITIDSLNIKKSEESNTLNLSLNGKTYFKVTKNNSL